jgi:hypothetical protein
LISVFRPWWDQVLHIFFYLPDVLPPATPSLSLRYRRIPPLEI